ncbi:CAP domain-containing protein [Paenibacillus arenilitoris]|uniref:SCP-like extracellular n=1 Tax=Paenibacillus arenilitoris TaxID=2772299 RepID=A0A927CH91_9BACL|nr:CAP domain-containing protein [Paenibacillus arenilitoris]MBD2868063.1 SCP-like extracellular [Paenibacillus arenilitoris]
MKMQPIRVGVASIIAATVIGAGASFTAPTASAAPAVNANSTVQYYTLNQDAINQIAGKYGIDLSKINFGGGTINCPIPGMITNPGAGTTNPGTGTTKPDTGTTTPSKPDTGTTTPSKPSTGTTTPSKPSTGTTNPSTGTSNQSAFQSQVIDLVNQERAKAGLSALKSDSLLTKVATEKARDMDVNNYFSHTSPTYGSPFDMMRQFGVTYSYAGENIASGQRTPQEVMNAWMNSSGHRANILNGNFTKIGVGYVNGEWVQMFIG